MSQKTTELLRYSKVKLTSNKRAVPSDWVRVVEIERKYGPAERGWLCKQIHRGQFKSAIKIMKTLSHTKGPMYIPFDEACTFVEEHHPAHRIPTARVLPLTEPGSVGEALNSDIRAEAIERPPADVKEVLDAAHLEYTLISNLKVLIEEVRDSNTLQREVIAKLEELKEVWE
jgi:hypothetical protein